MIEPQGQRELWPMLAAVPARFTLYGGTALAIQLGHRESVDFDFFSSQAFDPNQLQAGLGFLHSGRITQSSENTLSCVVPFAKGQAQVSFFGDLPLARVEGRRRTTWIQRPCSVPVRLWKGFCRRVRRSMESNSILWSPCEHSDFSTI
ncbi:MAG: nucleotidyl transferase AbiEii/AbiGii toxin family protein [Acidobacteria bacterium]|nr:nucleotidyl transferase AbiEii/AbiGii toxin family protein [Acidobacteriota bacterium]